MTVSRKIWLGVALAPALALGCRTAQTHDEGCATCGGTTAHYAPSHPSVVIVPSGAASTPAPAMLPPVAPPAVAPAVAPVSAPAPLVIPERAGPVTSMKVDISAEPAKRRTYADITANPAFQHSADYASLVGELHFNASHNTWRLRYASVDDEDRFGGSVTLDGVSHTMGAFKDGQMVRVEGEPVDRDSREMSPSYRVRDIQPLK